MKILVTGATGFIGSAFTRLALARGHSVGGMILPTEPPPPALVGSPNLTWLKGTLADPPWEAIAKFQPEACVHFAWIATPGVYLESPDNQAFLEWSIRFIRRAREIGVGHVVAAGTCIEYRIGQEPLSEVNTPIEPITTYARCKNELRLALEADHLEGAPPFCWGRVFYPYGLGEHPARLCSSIINKLSRGEKIILKTPHSTKDYIYIDDLAEAFLTVLEKRHAGIVNLGTGIGITVLEIAQRLERMMGKEGLVEEAVPPAVDPLGFVVAEASRLRGLGWSPAHDLERGLQKLLAVRV